MAFPPIHLTTLAALAHRLPASCWLAEALQRDAQAWGLLPVWCVEGDLDLAALDLSLRRSDDGHWLPPLPTEAVDAAHAHPQGALLWVNGHLHLQGALTSDGTGMSAHLLVMGQASMECAAVSGQQMHVQGDLRVRTLFWGERGDCSGEAAGNLEVLGHTSAQALLFTGGYRATLHQPHRCDFAWHEPAEADAPPFDPAPAAETLALLLHPSVLNPEATAQPRLADVPHRSALLQAARAGEPLTHTSEQVHALMPPPAALFADEHISAANLRAAVRSPVIAHKEYTATGWWGQTDFSLCRKHVDADGDARDDSVFITVWKTWDFYLAVEDPTRRRGWRARLAALPLPWRKHHETLPPTNTGTLTPTTQPEGLTMIYRRYQAGEPAAWQTLDPETDQDAWRACQHAWQGLLDYVRKGTAQARAHFPLWAQVQAEITPARLRALVGRRIFAERYNDWWDSDKNGFWAGPLWIGAREPCMHEGEPWGLAFKLSWAHGEDAPGDAPDNAHAAYQLELDEAREGPPLLHISSSQRQGDERAALPAHAADHLARLLRLWHQALRAVDEHETAWLATQPSPAPQPVRWLAEPPLPPTLPDEAVFDEPWMALSERWQRLGQEWVQQTRTQWMPWAAPEHTRGGWAEWPTEQHAEQAPEAASATSEELPPEDPRTPDASAALHLARAVHQQADAALSARFRQRFAFAADAYADHAYRSGQTVSQLCLLDEVMDAGMGEGMGYGTTTLEPRLLARVTTTNGAPQWVLLQGLRATPLPGLQGAGRSPQGRCFARCEAGRITTHLGWDGPVMATFEPPRGNEGTPLAWGLQPSATPFDCEELIPWDDGSRVLVRHASGVYLLEPNNTPDKPQAQPLPALRLHPQTWEEDGPYTWPKNQQQGALHLHMLHMALSPDGLHIAVGDQDSQHLLLDWRGQVIRALPPASAYACHAHFTQQGQRWWTHSCHLYDGRTQHMAWSEAGATAQWTASTWRIEASAPLLMRSANSPSEPTEHTLVGDAEGWLHALDASGHAIWHHYIGGAITAIRTSATGDLVWVSTQNGYVVRLQRLTQGMDAFSISTSPYAEVQRWIFWSDEPAPLCW